MILSWRMRERFAMDESEARLAVGNIVGRRHSILPEIFT
jgi:hypothetical protein